MGKQRGAIVIDGKVGGLSFYKSRYGDIVRAIGTVPKEKIVRDPKYAARRDAMSEFGYASRVGKLMRMAVQQHFRPGAEGSTNSRLTASIVRAIKADPIHERGKRRLTAHNADMLKGFCWREGLSMSRVMRTAYSISMGNEAALTISDLVPAEDIVAGAGATHADIVLLAAAIDPDGNTQVSTAASCGLIDLKERTAMAIRLNCALPAAGSGIILMAGIGLQPYQEVSGQMAKLAEGVAFELCYVGVVE